MMIALPDPTVNQSFMFKPEAPAAMHLERFGAFRIGTDIGLEILKHMSSTLVRLCSSLK